MNWLTKKLGEVLDYEQPGKYIVNSKNYSSEYKTPVLTAGKSFILGNTNEKDGIFPAEKLPVIIFDDFTTAIKFVDFPFKVKSSAMKILHTKKDIADVRYVFYAMQTKELNHTTHKRYWISEYSNIEIPLPPLSEQRKIVAKLERVLAKISEAKKLRAEAQEAAQNLLSAELHKIFENEKKGGLVKVGDICDIKGGKRLPRGHKLQIEKSNHPYIRVADFIPYGVDRSRIKFIDEQTYLQIKRYTISKDDVFISIAGTIGATGIIPEDLNGANLTENAAKLTNLRKIEQKYLMYMLTSDHVQNQVRGDLIQTTISKFGLFRIAKLKIPLPPIAEQKKIVARLDSLSEKIEKIKNLQSQTAADFKTLEQSILHQAFSN